MISLTRAVVVVCALGSAALYTWLAVMDVAPDEPYRLWVAAGFCVMVAFAAVHHWRMVEAWRHKGAAPRNDQAVATLQEQTE